MKTFVIGLSVIIFQGVIVSGFFIIGVSNNDVLLNAPLWIGLMGAIGATLNFFIANRNARKKDIAENYREELE